MNRVFRKIDSKLKALSTPVFIIVMTMLSIVIILPFLPLFYALERFIGPMGGPSLMQDKLIDQFIFGVLLIPLLETLIHQTAPIILLKKYTRLKPGTIILVSAILFGAVHFYSVSYIFYAFLIGLILAYAYMIYLEKNASAFWVVAAIHSLRNLFSLGLLQVV